MAPTAVRVGALRCFCLVRCRKRGIPHWSSPFSVLPRAPPQARNPSLVIAVRAEGLTLLVADNSTGYFGAGVPRQPWPAQALQAPVTRGGKRVCFLGSFATTEEAALCIARSPEGQAAAEPAAAPPLTSEEARQQAEAEGLTLLKADHKAGYFATSACPSTNPASPSPARTASVRQHAVAAQCGERRTGRALDDVDSTTRSS